MIFQLIKYYQDQNLQFKYVIEMITRTIFNISSFNLSLLSIFKMFLISTLILVS